ncbi:hypothetical protein HaloA020_16440 [Halomonas sp. A020]|nr:hypothetical protein HaloA020_16440 [Halomonas sp. A020]
MQRKGRVAGTPGGGFHTVSLDVHGHTLDGEWDAQALAQPLTVAFEVIGGGLKTVIDVQRAQSIAAAATHLGSQRQQQRGVQAAGEGNPNATPWRGLRQGVFEQA